MNANATRQSALPADHADRMARARLSLEGLSVGDAFGQQFFGWPEDARVSREMGRLPRAPWEWTDDTAMALSIFEVLRDRSGVDQDDLAHRFAARFAAEPTRGYGSMAIRILERIHAGKPWRPVAKAVFSGEGSRGNGGAMRVGPVGAYFADDLAAVVEQARRSAEVTHAHPDGQAGAIAVAVAAAQAWRMRATLGPDSRRELLETAIERTPESRTRYELRKALEFPLEAPVETAAQALGNGSEVCAHDTVPFTLWCAARHLSSFEDAMWNTVSGLGDRDTTCAIVGSIVAMAVGIEGIPAAWRQAREPLPV
jgi:ADP-ribosylglycohydrolase